MRWKDNILIVGTILCVITWSSRVAAALAWWGALSSSPFLISNNNQESTPSYQPAKTVWLRFRPIRIGIPGDTNTNKQWNNLIHFTIGKTIYENQVKKLNYWGKIRNKSKKGLVKDKVKYKVKRGKKTSLDKMKCLKMYKKK